MCVKDSFGWVEVDKQQVAAPEVVETVVGLAHAGMGPGVSPTTTPARGGSVCLGAMGCNQSRNSARCIVTKEWHRCFGGRRGD